MPKTTPHVNPEIHVPRPMIVWVSIRSISGMQSQRFRVIFVSGPNSDQHDNTHRMYLANDLNLNLNKTG